MGVVANNSHFVILLDTLVLVNPAFWIIHIEL